MGVFSEYDMTLRELQEALSEPDDIGQSIRSAFAAIDDLIVLANQQDTRAQVKAERVAIGQLLSRLETLASFVEIPRPRSFKVFSNAG